MSSFQIGLSRFNVKPKVLADVNKICWLFICSAVLGSGEVAITKWSTLGWHKLWPAAVRTTKVFFSGPQNFFEDQEVSYVSTNFQLDELLWLYLCYPMQPALKWPTMTLCALFAPIYQICSTEPALPNMFPVCSLCPLDGKRLCQPITNCS